MGAILQSAAAAKPFAMIGAAVALSSHIIFFLIPSGISVAASPLWAFAMLVGWFNFFITFPVLFALAGHACRKSQKFGVFWGGLSGFLVAFFAAAISIALSFAENFSSRLVNFVPFDTRMSGMFGDVFSMEQMFLVTGIIMALYCTSGFVFGAAGNFLSGKLKW